MKYYIGVDGGGTKTAFALFDANKNMVCTVTGPGSNHENFELGFPPAAKVIWEGICELVAKAGITLEDVDYTLMGLAGIDHQFQHDIMCGMLEEKGLRNFSIFNDGFIVVKAGSETGAAIGYNCGTGVCCNAIDSDGNMQQLGGLGEFSGDISGGVNIAITCFRLAYDDAFLNREKTAVTEKIYGKFNINGANGLLSLIANLEGDNADFYTRQLIDIFFEAAEAGDSAAYREMEKMADRGASLIAAHANKLHFAGDEIEVVLSGSMNVKLKNPTYTRLLMELAEKKCGRKLKFIKLSKAPVTGCINWIMQDFAKR